MEILGFEMSNWLVYLLVFLVSFYIYCIWPYGIFKQLGIPGPTPLPFFGNLLGFRKGLVYYDLEIVKKYGPYVGLYEGRHPVLLISDRDAVKQFLMKDFASFPNRRVFKTGGYPLDRSILILEDEEWKKMRSILSHVFTAGRIRRMIPLLNRSADRLASALLEKATRDEEFETKNVAGCFSMDSIAVTMFGVEVDSQRDPNDPFISNALSAAKFSLANPMLILYFFFPSLLDIVSRFRISILPKKVVNFFVDVTKSVMKEREDDPSTRRDDLIGILLEQESSLTAEDIFAQTLTFFLAGYDTTANMLSFVFYFMALHPEWQERVREEVNALGDLEYESLGKLRLMDQFINETLRLYPPGPRFDRIAKKDYELNGIPIRRGMCVSVPVYAIHRDPERWSDPEEFRPERFETEPDLGDFIPFGAGPRACIGMRFALMEAKLAIAKVLKTVKIVTCPRTTKEIRMPSITMNPIGGLWVKAEALATTAVL